MALFLELLGKKGILVAPCGLLNLNKPPGMTSRRAVDIVQRLGPRIKAGHAGTLDPLASGVLVVCVGAATRLIDYLQRMSKCYEAAFLLGRQSPTEDVDGPVTELPSPPVPSLDAVIAAAGRLTGAIEQRPPAFSALKVQGRRAYDLARKGQRPDLAPRTVMVYRLDVVAYAYPELQVRVECGSGTYVRALGRDLAASLETAAVMSRLVRTAVGSFRLEEAVSPEALSAETWIGHLLPPVRAVESLPRVELTPIELQHIRAGRTIPRRADGPEGSEIAAVDAAGRLAAILVPRGPGAWGPVRNFPIEEPMP